MSAKPCTEGGPAHTPSVRPDGEVRCIDCRTLLEEPVCEDCGRAIIDCDEDPVVGDADNWSYRFGEHYTTTDYCPRIVREDYEVRVDHLISMREGR